MNRNEYTVKKYLYLFNYQRNLMEINKQKTTRLKKFKIQKDLPEMRMDFIYMNSSKLYINNI